MRRQRSVNDIVAWLHAGDDAERVAGNAFLVSPRLALTCAHVVRDHLGLGKPTPRELPDSTVRLKFQGLRMEALARVAPSGWWPGGDEKDTIEDVAVLELLSPLDDVYCAGLAFTAPPPEFQCEVYATAGGYQTVGQTVYAQLTSRPNARGWRQLDARSGRESSYFVRRGFSGSPVLDPLGMTIWGMVSTVETAPDLLIAYAIPGEDLCAVTRSVEKATKARGESIVFPRERIPGPLDQLAREALVAVLGEDLPGGEAEAEGRELEPERLEQLRAGIRGLAELASKASDVGMIEHALEQLKHGEKAEAERLFSAIIEGKQAEGAVAYQQAWEAARQLGALAYGEDTKKSIEAYSTATSLDPDDTSSWVLLGQLYRRAGSLVDAELALERALRAAERVAGGSGLGVVYHELGLFRRAKGDFPGALADLGTALHIRERLAMEDPGNAIRLYDLGTTYITIGDVRFGHHVHHNR